MGKLGCAYVLVQACLSRFVMSASPPLAFDMMDTPLIGSDHVPNSSSSDSIIFTNMNTQSITINDPSNAPRLQVRCNGQKFGTALNLQSCAATVAMIAPYDKEEKFAMRPYEGEDIDCGLPYRWLNVDGLCKVQLFLLAPATVAHASTSQIKDAALAIYDKCGAGTPSKGGVASNIGGDNNLAVVLGATSYPNVICDSGGRGPSRRACAAIVSIMDTSPTRQLFGPVGPGLVEPDVKLPYFYRSSDDRCWGFVTSSEEADYSNWYSLWEGASAVDHMCVSRVKNGEAQKIGEGGRLRFTMANHDNETDTA